MPPKLKPNQCKHQHKIKRSHGFDLIVQKQAEAKGLSLPDMIQFDFCPACWQINPQFTETNDGEAKAQPV